MSKVSHLMLNVKPDSCDNTYKVPYFSWQRSYFFFIRPTCLTENNYESTKCYKFNSNIYNDETFGNQAISM